MNAYNPSKAEVQWYAEANICKLANAPFQIRSMRQYLRGNAEFMSHMHNRTIEPLTGIGRHPFSRVGCGFSETNLFNTSYLILDSHCTQAQDAHAQTVLFDMGCARFRSEHTNTASASGDSISLLINMYKKSCIHFDKIWAWESKKYDSWWAGVPKSLKEKITFANEHVNATAFETALLTTAALDYVVVKLDIDNTKVEMTIIDVIMRNAHLVDELFFEYHYYFDGIDFGWGKQEDIKDMHNAWTAVNLMAKLRRMGIRAHFWV